MLSIFPHRYVWRVGGAHEFELPLSEGQLYEKRPHISVGPERREAPLPNCRVVWQLLTTRHLQRGGRDVSTASSHVLGFKPTLELVGSQLTSFKGGILYPPPETYVYYQNKA